MSEQVNTKEERVQAAEDFIAKYPECEAYARLNIEGVGGFILNYQWSDERLRKFLTKDVAKAEERKRQYEAQQECEDNI